VEDIVSFTGTSISATTLFGLATTAVGEGGSGYFQPLPIYGIFGMAQADLASAVSSALFTTFQTLLNQTGSLSWSMCLTDNSPSMILNSPFTNDNRFQYTPLSSTSTKGFYIVTLSDIEVNGNTIGIPSSVYNDGSVIVDSGTSSLILVEKAFTALRSSFLALCNSSPNIVGLCDVEPNLTIFDGWCYQYSSHQLSALPTVTVSVGQLNPLTLTSSDYMVYVASQQLYCLGIASQPDGSSPSVILGDTFMSNFNVVFNLETQTIGFGPLSTCTGSAAGIPFNALLLVCLVIVACIHSYIL